MTAFQVYLLTRLESVVNVAGMTGLFSAILATAFFAAMYIGERSDVESHKKAFKHSFYVFLASGLIGIITPNKGDLAVIFGLSYATSNEQISKLPDNAAKAVNKFLEDYAGEKK